MSTDTGLPSDALRWTIEYLIEMWGSESIPVIMETLEEAHAPGLVLDIVWAMNETVDHEPD